MATAGGGFGRSAVARAAPAGHVAVRLTDPGADSVLRQLDGSTIEISRPKSTTKKSFSFGLGAFADEGGTEALYASAVRPRVCAAVARRRSCYVLSAGSHASGKSRTMRGEGGVIALGLRDAVHALSGVCEGETMLTLSAAACVISMATGKTPSGKQPTRERVVDLLLPRPRGPVSAGLKVHEHGDSASMPHAAPFYAEGQVEAVVADEASGLELLRGALARCAEEEADAASLRAHLFVKLTVRSRSAAAAASSAAASPGADEEASEFESVLGFVDVGGVGRPQPGKPTGEDPAVKAINRIVDVLAGADPSASNARLHVPYRDSSLTKLVAPALGGRADSLHLVHVTGAKYDEADAILSHAAKLDALPRGMCALEAADAAFPWSVTSRLRAATGRADALCASLGVGPRAGLASSSIELTHDSSDEMLELQTALLDAERLEHRLGLWERIRQRDECWRAGDYRAACARDMPPSRAAPPAAPPAEPLAELAISELAISREGRAAGNGARVACGGASASDACADEKEAMRASLGLLKGKVRKG